MNNKSNQTNDIMLGALSGVIFSSMIDGVIKVYELHNISSEAEGLRMSIVFLFLSVGFAIAGLIWYTRKNQSWGSIVIGGLFMCGVFGIPFLITKFL